MTRDVVVANVSLPIAAAWTVLERERVRHLPVVEQGVLVGIVSDRDLLLTASRADAGKLSFPDKVLGEIMSTAVVTCTANTSVAEAARLMIDKKIDALPVVAGSRLVGIVTSTDLLGLLLEYAPAQSLPFDFRVEEIALVA